MKNIEKFKNIKLFIKAFQLSQLDIIAEMILEDQKIGKEELKSKNRADGLPDIKRRIAFVARINYNISGDVLANYFNMSKEQISDYIHTAYDRARKDNEYYELIRSIMVRLNHYHTQNLRPII